MTENRDTFCDIQNLSNDPKFSCGSNYLCADVQLNFVPQVLIPFLRVLVLETFLDDFLPKIFNMVYVVDFNHVKSDLLLQYAKYKPFISVTYNYISIL